jgi:hypothetical protein
MFNQLNLDQIKTLIYIIDYLHVFLTGLVIIIFFLTFKFKQIWQFYLILGIFFLQQAILNGCFLSFIQNELARPLGYQSINNQFMFGYYNGQYLTYFRVLAGILGTFYLYMSYWCVSNKIRHIRDTSLNKEN